MNDEAGVDDQGRRRLVIPQIEDCRDGCGRVKGDILDAVRVKVALLKHPVGGRVTVEGSEPDVPRLAALFISKPFFRAEAMEGRSKSEEVKMK
jgi:hypothetical protein